jgi:hypothetical protein
MRVEPYPKVEEAASVNAAYEQKDVCKTLD